MAATRGSRFPPRSLRCWLPRISPIIWGMARKPSTCATWRMLGPMRASAGLPSPLLDGERAHYELAAGDRNAAESLLSVLKAFASGGHLIPEQVWDGENLPERELFRGRPSGSAMPLVWAHAQHVKLLRS